MKGKRFLYLFVLFVLAVVCGCSPITKELRHESAPLTFAEVFKDPAAYKGKIVVWGGEIAAIVNQKDGTSLVEVIERPLDWREEPKRTEASGGRFLVLVEKFVDPHIYRPDREITVAGEIFGERKKFLGEMEYRYPLLLSKQIHLWRQYRYAYPPLYYPYFPHYPWGYYDPWYGDPWRGYPL